MKKEYWFLIEAFVHISIKRDCLLLYNPLNGSILEYEGMRNRKILDLVKRITSPTNLLVIKITQVELEDKQINEFITKVRERFMGDLIDISYSLGKPILMTPVVTIEKDLQLARDRENRSDGEELLKYLAEITLYINNYCNQKCYFCQKAFKQFPACTTSSSGGEPINIFQLKELFENIKSSNLINLNILGGNIFKYESFNQFVDYMNQQQFKKTYFSHYLNLDDETGQLKLLNPNTSSLKIIISFPADTEKLEKSLTKLKKISRLKTIYIFIVQNKEEYINAEKLIYKNKINSFEFAPFYNGDNILFFQEGIFPEKEDVLKSNSQLNDIFAKSKINLLNFGRLTILGGGEIHSNINNACLGILGKDSLQQVLFKEMTQGKSWRKIRRNVVPCEQCTYQDLCPPLSNYNYVIGKNDLCHRKTVL